MLSFALLWIVILLFVVFFYTYCVKPHSYWKNRGILQGRSVWMFGENWKLILKQESFAESVRRIYRKFPNTRYFGTYVFNNPAFIVRDPELIKLITIKDFEHFVDHRMWVPGTSDPIWSHTLFSLGGEKWKEMRTFLSPAFTGSKMRNMFILMKTAAENFIKHLENENKDFMELNLRDTFNRYTCDVIATTGFGIEVDSLKNLDNEFYLNAKEAGNFTGFKMAIFFVSFFLPSSIIKLLGLKVFSEKVSKFFISLVDESIKTRQEKNIIRPDMIHLLMEARKGRNKCDEIEGEDIDTGFESSENNSTNMKLENLKMELTNTEIAAQALIFIIGGFETLSTLMRFLAYELAVHPDIQDKLRIEINETLKCCENHLTYEAIQKMKYMDMVVSECLRKWPSGSIMDRICTKPYTIPALHPGEKEITLEKGTLVWIPTMGLHFDPKYYKNPEKFDPERFSDENKKERNPYVFLPFGEGPRNCIGNRFAIVEAKVIIFHLLKSFEIVPVEKTIIPINIVRNTMLLDGDSFIFGLKKLK